MTLRLMTILSTLLISLSPAWAFNINVSNGETGTALFVKIYDMNTAASDKVFDRSMDSGSPTPVELTSADSKGHIKWEAMTNDRKKCGSGEEKDLDNGANVTVSAPSTC